jgi:hypothetical protein
VAIKYDGKACGYCGTKTRRAYAVGRGGKTRLQHSRWWTCEKGHKIFRKG